MRKFSLSKAELTRLYWKERKTIRQIADAVGVCYATALEWMVRYGIPRRSHQEAHKGINLGRKIPDEMREIISKSLKGRRLKREHRERISRALKKYHKKHPEARIGENNSFYGRTHSLKTRMQNSEKQKGEKSPSWKGGITPLHMQIRNSFEFREWRRKVYEKDNHTCQGCGRRGWKEGVPLDAHHIKPFSDYPNLRFDVSNGITLCAPCHDIIHFGGN